MPKTTTLPQPRRARPTRAEQETVFRWDEEEKLVYVWSASPVTWRKLARLGIRPVRETSREGQPTGKFYRLPLARFRWGLKRASSGNPRNLAIGAVGARDPGRKVFALAQAPADGS